MNTGVARSYNHLLRVQKGNVGEEAAKRWASISSLLGGSKHKREPEDMFGLPIPSDSQMPEGQRNGKAPAGTGAKKLNGRAIPLLQKCACETTAKGVTANGVRSRQS